MGKAFDVIVVGELNVDLIFNQIDGFPEVGKEILADQMIFALGSSSAICASNLSALGLDVAFLGKLGSDVFGRFVLNELKQKGVDTSYIQIDDQYKTGATMALSYGNDRAMVTHQGAMLAFGISNIDETVLKKARHLHFSSYFFQPGFNNSLDTLFKKAKEAGLTTSLDVQWDPAESWDLDLDKVLPWVDVFIPNAIELKKLTKQHELNLAIQSVKNKSKYTVVKCGIEGSILSYGNKTVEKSAFVNESVVDTIGAGDSFNAGYILKFLDGQSPEDCQQFGNLIGAISTTAPGGTAAIKDLETTMAIARKRFNYSE